MANCKDKVRKNKNKKEIYGKYDDDIIMVGGNKPTEFQERMVEFMLDRVYDYIEIESGLKKKDIIIYSIGMVDEFGKIWTIDYQNKLTKKYFNLKMKLKYIVEDGKKYEI
ncbi:MAG: hypothetical protein ACFFG0_49710 [Candidatus Thorarchaeota archaeon]